MDYSLTLAPLQNANDLWTQIITDPGFSAIEAHPQCGQYGRAYYPAYWGSDYRDLSFAVIWQGRPALVVLCGVIDKVLGLHGLPMQIFCRQDIVDHHALMLAAKTAFTHINQLALEAGAKEIALRDTAKPVLSPVSEVALGYEAKVTMALNGMVDLTAGPAVWKASLRKSFHQFVNWGRKSLVIEYVNGQHPDQEKFDAYREFHARIAGRVTRPIESWNAQYAELARGRGELILGHLDGVLVAGSLFIDGTETTIYMNGVYDREMDKPLAHYMIWHGIERAHGRGLKNFQLGDIHLPDAVDDKRHSIGYFKRGFATYFEAATVWKWPPKGVAVQT